MSFEFEGDSVVACLPPRAKSAMAEILVSDSCVSQPAAAHPMGFCCRGTRLVVSPEVVSRPVSHCFLPVLVPVLALVPLCSCAGGFSHAVTRRCIVFGAN